MARLKYYSKKTNAWETVDSTFGTGNVKTVNGVEPDANGNIEIAVPEMPEINYPVTSVNGMTGDVMIEVGSEQNMVQSDLSQNDPEALDYVKHRTHWEEGNQTVIEWDGNTEGRDTFPDSPNSAFYCISGNVPTVDEVVGGSVVCVYPDGILNIEITDAMCHQEDGVVAVGEDVNFIYIVGADAAAAAGFVPGIYAIAGYEDAVGIGAPATYISAFSYGSTVVHQLDEKFIPDSIARKTDIPKLDATLTKSGAAADAAAVGAAIERIAGQNAVQSSWAQNDPEAPDFVKGRTHYEENRQTVIEWDCNTEGRDVDATMGMLYKVSDLTPSKEDVVGGYAEVSGGEDFASGEFEITESDVSVGQGGIFIGEGICVAHETECYFENFGATITFPSPGVYFVKQGEVFAYKLTYGSTVVHPLDERFIPESVARVEDMTWENLPDKPFCDVQTVIEWDGSTEGRETSGDAHYHVSGETPTVEDLSNGVFIVSMEDGSTMDMAITDDSNNMDTEENVFHSMGVCVAYIDGATYGGVIFPKAGVYFLHQDGMGYVSKLTYSSTKTVDEKFIPDTIARKSDIPAAPVTSVNGMTGDVVIEVGSGSGSSVQVDLSQNDETAADYVKNRTHWKEETTEILFSETNIDFSDMVSRPVTFQLDEGAYIVTIDGETYYYELLTYNGINYIGDIQGNPILVYVREGDLLIAMADSGVHSIEIYRDKTIYHKLDSRYIDAVQEFIIPIDFNNATLTDSATSGHFAGSQRYKVAIETPYYEIVKEYSAGKHLIVRLDNMGYQSYFFTLVSTNGTSFRFESTFIMSPNTTRITNLYLELGQQSIGSDTAKVFLQTTTIETNMPPEPASAIADLTEAPTAEDFNALLAALRSRGYLATE